MKKIYLLIGLFFLFSLNVSALNINSKNYIMYNLNDDKLVLSQGEDEIISIASMTKIMTTLVAIENIADFDQKVTITEAMIAGLEEADAAMINLRPGDEVTYRDLLYGTMLASGADATRALAITIAGSEEAYAEMMNNKAEELGLINTSFANSWGIEDAKHYSSVKEVAIILKAALANDFFKTIYQTRSYEFASKNLTVNNTLFNSIDYLKLEMPYIIGGKTGYTKKAGRCLASTAYDEQNGIYYLLVTAGAPTDYNELFHVKDAREIYEYVFASYKYFPLVKAGDELVTLKTENSKAKSITFKSAKDYSYYDKSINPDEIEIEYQGLKILSPKLKIGDYIGLVTVKYGDEIIEQVSLTLEAKIEFSLISYLINNWIYTLFGTALIIVIIIVIMIIKKNIKKGSKKGKILC